MCRPRQYANAAEKYRAYRARRAAEMILVNRASLEALETRVSRLTAAVQTAREAGCPIAGQMAGASVHAMLDELASWFEARAAGKR